VGYGENTKGYRIYVAGQREVIISHDVTFDEDMALSKVINLPSLRSYQEADTREPKEKDDESMPDVEEPMDPIDPPPYEPSSSKKRPSWLKGLLDDAVGPASPQSSQSSMYATCRTLAQGFLADSKSFGKITD